MAIKAGLRQKYRQFLKDRPQISNAVKVAVGALDKGRTPMQVEDALFDFDLTAMETGVLARALTKFHQRGLEFRAYWNKRNNAPDNEGLNDETITIGFNIRKRKQSSV